MDHHSHDMPTLTKTRAMSHADSLATLNAAAKRAATKEAEKKKNDKKKEEEEQAEIQQASEEKKRDAKRLKAGKCDQIFLSHCLGRLFIQ